MLRLFSVAALLGSAFAQNSSALPTVDLGYEIYRAATFNETGNFYNFSNIRYAAPPVGDLRFAPPQPPVENRTAINPGNLNRICPQAGPAWSAEASTFLTSLLLGVPYNTSTNYVPPGANSSSPVPAADPRESEDCLFLDVFVPEDILDKAGKGYGAPVLVWIYGGGYTGGNKNGNPAGLIAASGNYTNGDVIIVSLNYRLGAFGWSSGPSYQAEGGTANVGLYDQRFALEWVQQYIHLFGGDKNRVTVFGESAGGGSIMHQITAYGGLKGKAPFQQAIPQSPGWQAVQSNVQMEDTYRTLLNLTNTSSLAELRALPYESLRRANVQQVAYTTAWGQFAYGPTVDGNFVPQQPGQLLAQGRFDKDVNVMVGHNANEGPSFTAPFIQNDAELRRQLNTGYPYMPNSSVDYIVEVLYPPVFDGSYPYKTQYERATLIISEGAFTCNNYYLAKAYKNETYNYLFAVPPAFHGFDVAYTFFLGGATSLLPTDVTNRTVALALQDFITSFAEKGVPEAPGITMFDMYGENASVLRLNITGIDEIRDVNANKRCDWWQLALFS